MPAESATRRAPANQPPHSALSRPGAACALLGAAGMGFATFLAQRLGQAGPVAFSVAGPSCVVWVVGCLVLYKAARRDLGGRCSRLRASCALCGRLKVLWRRHCRTCTSDRVRVRTLGRVIAGVIALECSLGTLSCLRMAADSFALFAASGHFGFSALMVHGILCAGMLSICALGSALAAWRGTAPGRLQELCVPLELIAQNDNVAVIALSVNGLFLAALFF